MSDAGQMLVLASDGSTVYSSAGRFSELSSGAVLVAGQFLTSPDGRSRLVVQTDGNLVSYTDGVAR